PQVLILHTHATESYETHTGDHYDTRSSWRTRDNGSNMCAIGDIVAKQLEEAGIAVVHNTTQHDYPSYNGSYDRSRQTVEEIMAQHPNIKVILDIHRDAIQRDQTTIVAPITTIAGEECAQVMLIVGCDDGSLNMPNWRQNLRFGAELQNRLEEDWPTLTRPLFFAHRKYNQDMAPGAVLIEMGASGNTFEQAARSAEMVGQTLADLFAEMEED
ncbi:MAG: stage II sporulation protein P, partial [Oscillospiraceae bacterium]|nr:stage II sporulation protein P [Oscillospiraceae bacterium]